DILETVEASATKATGYGFQLELSYRAHRLGARIVEVPITFNDRVRGVSKMSWHIIGEAMSLVTWWGLRDRVLRRAEPVPARPAQRTAPGQDEVAVATEEPASGEGAAASAAPGPVAAGVADGDVEAAAP